MIGSLEDTSMVRVNTLQYLVPQCEIANSLYLSHRKALEEKASSTENMFCLHKILEVTVKCSNVCPNEVSCV